MLSTGLWQHTKMITTLKSPNGLKNCKCKKGQLSNRPPIPYVPETDLFTSEEEPHVLKVKLLDDTCLNMPIYTRVNTEEYLAHIVAVLRIIKIEEAGREVQEAQKAVVKQSGALKNLLEATGSKDTVLSDVDVEAHKVKIEQTQ